MRRGTKPKPTALKLLHNNPGGRPLNAFEPEHPALDPTPPPVLAGSELALAEWNRIVPTLARGHVTHVDAATLAGYCLKYGQWQALEAEAARHAYIVKGVNNGPMPNPAISLANRVMLLWLRAASEFGITPSSRSRIVAAPTTPDEGDAFTQYQFALQRRRQQHPQS